MRAESAADAAWLGEVCAAWGVVYHRRAAPTPVRTEAKGRELRYDFFAELAEGLGTGTAILTGHTADDQAETVLFRMARGSGPRGLSGIHPGRSPSPVRPLLPFRRSEVEAYAAANGVPHREDPTRAGGAGTRTGSATTSARARGRVPGAAASLAALASSEAGMESAALEPALDDRIAALASARSAAPSRPGLSFDREAIAALPDPILTVLLRRVATRLGGSPGRGATASLLRFVREAPSGRRVELAGGVAVEHHLGVLRFGGPADGRADTCSPPDPRPAAPPASGLPGPPGLPMSYRTPSGRRSSRRRMQCHRVLAAQRRSPPLRATGRSLLIPHFDPASVRFPLDVRPWAPGDRMTLPYGKKKVKKILLEARVPADRREGWPVVADADGCVVWVPGSADPSPDPASTPQRELLRLEVTIRS